MFLVYRLGGCSDRKLFRQYLYYMSEGQFSDLKLQAKARAPGRKRSPQI
jgi:hypothetical protein